MLASTCLYSLYAWLKSGCHKHDTIKCLTQSQPITVNVSGCFIYPFVNKIELNVPQKILLSTSRVPARKLSYASHRTLAIYPTYSNLQFRRSFLTCCSITTGKLLASAGPVGVAMATSSAAHVGCLLACTVISGLYGHTYALDRERRALQRTLWHLVHRFGVLIVAR